MTPKTLMLSMLLATSLSATAATPSPPTAQEQVLLSQMREAAKRQGIEMSPEMEMAALQRMREMQINILGLQMATQGGRAKMAPPMPAPSSASMAPAATPAVPSANPSQDGWLAAIERHRSNARKTNFEDSRDGFTADGKAWLDAEGEIERYSADRTTGNVTYLVQRAQGNYVVRFANMHSSDAPVTVGQINSANGRETYSGMDGTQLSGEQIIPVADGLIAARGSAFFRYSFGAAPKSFALPPEYGILYAQRGDVFGTGYILVVKQGKVGFLQAMSKADIDRDGKVTELDTKRVKLFGQSAPDFALVNISNGQLALLPRSEATTHFAWKHRYLNDGRRNRQHFYNAINWQQTSIGPVAIVFSDSGTKVFALNLTSGQQVEVFNRPMGINEWRSMPTDNGGLLVEAQLGFKHETIEDVRTLFSAGN